MKTEEQESFYNDLSHVEAGPGRKRQSSLSEILPIRLSKEDLERVRAAASSEGRPASAWIRQTILKAIEGSIEPNVDASTSAHVDPVSASSLAIVQPSIVLEPFKIIAAQIVATVDQVVSGLQRSFERILGALDGGGGSDDFFTERVFHDSDSFLIRPRRFDREFAALAANDVQLTQTAILRLSRLSELASGSTLLKTSTQLRTRIREIQDLLGTTEKEVVSRRPLSAYALVGLEGFYEYIDWARTTLTAVDQELSSTINALTASGDNRDPASVSR